MGIKAGIVQMNVKLGDLTGNVDAAVAGIRQAADQGARIAVLPELWSCGFDNKSIAMHAEKTPDILVQTAKIAKECQILIAGTLPESIDGRVYNTHYLQSADGMTIGAYRKIHLFTPTKEDVYFDAGSSPVICDTPIGCVGLLTCYDLRFPELSRTLALKGAVILIVSAQWPKTRVRHWDVLLQARAIENQLAVIGVNRCGADPLLVFPGHSQILSPIGDVLVKAGEKEERLVAEINTEEIIEFREKIPCLRDRVPSAYEC